MDRLPVDLIDIYSVCVCYQVLIDRLLALPVSTQKDELNEIFDEIYENLYVHLPYHYKGLLKGLEKVSTKLEPDDKRREAASDARLEKTLDKVSHYLQVNPDPHE